MVPLEWTQDLSEFHVLAFITWTNAHVEGKEKKQRVTRKRERERERVELAELTGRSNIGVRQSFRASSFLRQLQEEE